MIVKVVGRDKKDKNIEFIQIFDDITKATNYIRRVLIYIGLLSCSKKLLGTSVAKALAGDYEIVVTVEDEGWK